MRWLTLFTLLLIAGFTRAQSHLLFVGTYTNTGNLGDNPNLDSTGSKGIYVYRFDATTGKATRLSHTRDVCNPSYLAIAPGGKRLYSCTESRMKEKGSLSVFDIDAKTGRLSLIGKVSSLGDNPAYVAVNTAGNQVTVANYTGGSYTLYPIGPDGMPGKPQTHTQHFGKGFNPARQEAPHVHSAVYGPDSRYLYVQDLGLDQIAVVSPSTGEEVSQIKTPPGSGPRHLSFHPNGKFAYLIEEMGGYVDVYRYEPSTGGLDSLQRIAAHPDTTKGPFRSSDIHVSPDGRFLYAGNRAETTIAIFSIEPSTGLLRPLGYVPTMGVEPRNFTLDPSGKWLLVANQESDTIVIFHVDTQTGMPQPSGRIVKVPKPTCLKME
ncbi:MAG TPA: lactonase family protein [Puia sp.]|uniref:lactonase family protein n=1 Tax=Puia sp. TaxID=2045100 RepID=UPI002BEC58EB|nr:lactonase family protein [Puia sp.]HVU97700.1 lactonase family protein [Puia sp.]